MPQCLFCDNRRLTNEHIWPEWVVEAFKTLVPPKGRRFKATATLDRRVIRSYRADTITQKRHLVCRACNNDWMSAIEGYAKPILLPLLLDRTATAIFGPEEQIILAVWMTLRSMIFDATCPNGASGQYYSRAERIAFADSDTLDPPRNTYIWIAPVSAVPFRATYDTIAAEIDEAKTDGFHVLTCLMHQVALQLLTWKGSDRTIKHRRLNRDGWSTASRHIWPPRTSPIAWPPQTVLSQQGLDSLFDRFKPARESRGR